MRVLLHAPLFMFARHANAAPLYFLLASATGKNIKMVLLFYDIDVLHGTWRVRCTLWLMLLDTQIYIFGNETLTSIKRRERTRVFGVCAIYVYVRQRQLSKLGYRIATTLTYQVQHDGQWVIHG